MHFRFSIFDSRFLLAAQSQIANHKSKFPLCLACGPFLLLLTSCQKEEASREEAPAPRTTTVRSAEPQLANHVPPPAPAPPLRRTATSSEDLSVPQKSGGDAIPGFPTPAISAVLQDSGAIRLHLALAPPYNSSALTEEIEKLGFDPEPPAGGGEGLWTRAVTSGERAAFEKLVLARLQETSRSLEHVQSLEVQSRRPGRVVWMGPEEPGRFLSGRLVYTGHPLDIALADAGGDPHLFLAVESRTAPPSPASVYVRGGRLFVGEDWTLGLDEFKPAGELKKVPFETERISVRPDGQVLAFSHEGTSSGLGWLQVVRLAAFKPAAQAGSVESVGAPQAVACVPGESPLRPGHLEYGAFDLHAPVRAVYLLAASRLLTETLRALDQPVVSAKATIAPSGISGPIVIHADLAWTEQHLKALGVPVERTPGHTVIPLGHDPQKVVDALAKVLQVLRLRMATHDQNLRNADRVRDADNRLNPYRRKVIRIGPQGEAVEEADSSPFRKLYKPGDPNADADGNITLPNVNSALEMTDFQAAAEEYKLVRACMERLAPQQIFPDPPPLPPRPEAR